MTDNEITSDVIEKCNIPQILNHWEYQNSKYWGKMHDENGELLHVHDIPENLGFDEFLEGTPTHNFADKTSQSFLVNKSEIEKNDYDLSINRYKEIVYEEVQYDAPEVLIEQIKNLDTERATVLQNLEAMLNN